jgi:hypothetical protein
MNLVLSHMLPDNSVRASVCDMNDIQSRYKLSTAVQGGTTSDMIWTEIRRSRHMPTIEPDTTGIII